jgi:hypothetical protein
MRSNEQTIAKEIGFAKAHGWCRIVKANVPRGRQFLTRAAAGAAIIVPCWGDRTKVPRALHLEVGGTLRLLQPIKPLRESMPLVRELPTSIRTRTVRGRGDAKRDHRPPTTSTVCASCDL